MPPTRPASSEARASFWLLGLGLLLTPVAVAIAAGALPHVPIGGAAADAGAFVGATFFPIVGLSLAARVEVRLAVALSVAAVAAASLATFALWQPNPVVTVLF